jgi:hypothetical protein
VNEVNKGARGGGDDRLTTISGFCGEPHLSSTRSQKAIRAEPPILRPACSLAQPLSLAPGRSQRMALSLAGIPLIPKNATPCRLAGAGACGDRGAEYDPPRKWSLRSRLWDDRGCWGRGLNDHLPGNPYGCTDCPNRVPLSRMYVKLPTFDRSALPPAFRNCGQVLNACSCAPYTQ